jgi:hypothetical protein
LLTSIDLYDVWAIGKQRKPEYLVLCLQSQRNRWYYLEVGTRASKSKLAPANDKKELAIFYRLHLYLIAKAIDCVVPDANLKEFEDYEICAINTTTIDLCLEVFWWAKFRKHKAVIRLHKILDIKSG